MELLNLMQGGSRLWDSLQQIRPKTPLRQFSDLPYPFHKASGPLSNPTIDPPFVEHERRLLDYKVGIASDEGFGCSLRMVPCPIILGSRSTRNQLFDAIGRDGVRADRNERRVGFKLG